MHRTPGSFPTLLAIRRRKASIASQMFPPILKRDIIKAWHASGHLGKAGKGVAGDPEKFWRLDVSRSEPPWVATNQVNGARLAEEADGRNSKSVIYRDAVVTNQVAAVATWLVTTAPLISDQPGLYDEVSF